MFKAPSNEELLLIWQLMKRNSFPDTPPLEEALPLLQNSHILANFKNNDVISALIVFERDGKIYLDVVSDGGNIFNKTSIQWLYTLVKHSPYSYINTASYRGRTCSMLNKAGWEHLGNEGEWEHYHTTATQLKDRWRFING